MAEALLLTVNHCVGKIHTDENADRSCCGTVDLAKIAFLLTCWVCPCQLLTLHIISVLPTLQVLSSRLRRPLTTFFRTLHSWQALMIQQ